ncbi:MAG: hypothetical protein ACOCV2_14995, partial [Persicimonas sp.]
EQNTSGAEQNTSGAEQNTSSRTELLQELPSELRERVKSLKARAPVDEMQALVRDLCAWRPMRPIELEMLLDRSRSRVLAGYVKPLVEAGELERTEASHHPGQFYRVTSTESDE